MLVEAWLPTKAKRRKYSPLVKNQAAANGAPTAAKGFMLQVLMILVCLPTLMIKFSIAFTERFITNPCFGIETMAVFN
ncbi:hypothetical protein [Ferruginibacter sp.]|nr:hypothetical protein [Ferruginibacter sp.]